MTIIQIQVDEEIIKDMLQAAIDKKLSELDKELVFWDSKELRRRTCLSWNTIQEQFFHNPEFPKAKVGSKWLFPAKETEEFLLNWLKGKSEE